MSNFNRNDWTKYLKNKSSNGTKCPNKESKYHNKLTIVEGIKFDSKKESQRYLDLRMMQKFGLISKLEIQKRYDFKINDFLVTYYKADFTYFNKEGKYIVEDVKSEITRKNTVYRIKKKLMKAIYNIEILET